jgi:hypothetical protein
MSHHDPVVIAAAQIVGTLAAIACGMILILVLFGATALIVTVGLFVAAFIARALYEDDRETKKLLGQLDRR